MIISYCFSAELFEEIACFFFLFASKLKHLNSLKLCLLLIFNLVSVCALTTSTCPQFATLGLQVQPFTSAQLSVMSHLLTLGLNTREVLCPRHQLWSLVSCFSPGTQSHVRPSPSGGTEVLPKDGVCGTHSQLTQQLPTLIAADFQKAIKL